MFKRARFFLFVFFVSAAGMGAGSLFASYFIPQAQAAGVVDVLRAARFELLDKFGRSRIILGTSDEGSPAIWFLDEKGKSRLNLGLYGDGNSFVVLNDKNEQAVQILRTVGDTNGPALIMKSNGQDRMVMGVNFFGNPEPVFYYIDEKGSRRDVFGKTGG